MNSRRSLALQRKAPNVPNRPVTKKKMLAIIDLDTEPTQVK